MVHVPKLYYAKWADDFGRLTLLLQLLEAPLLELLTIHSALYIFYQYYYSMYRIK